jgi:hypothetical protein
VPRVDLTVDEQNVSRTVSGDGVTSVVSVSIVDAARDEVEAVDVLAQIRVELQRNQIAKRLILSVFKNKYS